MMVDSDVAEIYYKMSEIIRERDRGRHTKVVGVDRYKKIGMVFAMYAETRIFHSRTMHSTRLKTCDFF